MRVLGFLNSLFSQSGDSKHEDEEEEYPTYEQCLEEKDPDQYYTYIELSTSWDDADEDE